MKLLTWKLRYTSHVPPPSRRCREELLQCCLHFVMEKRVHYNDITA